MTDTIKISNETLNSFKKLYDISQSLKIGHQDVETKVDDDGEEYEVTVIRSRSQNNAMMARVEIPEQFPRDVNLYDLREFNSVVGIVNDPEFDLSKDGDIKIISSDGKQKLRYMETNPDLVTTYVGRDIKLPSIDIELTLKESQLKSIMTSAQTMKLGYVGFVGDGEKISITSFDKNNGDQKDTNSFSIELTESDMEFRLFYKLDYHNIQVLLGEGDLMFSISGSKKVSQVETESGKIFWISFDPKSEF